MIQGRERGVMKAWTMGEECRVVREVSQGFGEVSCIFVSLCVCFASWVDLLFMVELCMGSWRTYEYLLCAQHVAHHLGHVAEELICCIVIVWYARQRSW